MVANIVLLFLVFGAAKRKKSPYIAALVLGGVKGVLYLIFSRNLQVATIMGCGFAALASAFVYFLLRLDRRAPGEEPGIPTYSSPGTEKVTFKWEYFPLTILLLFIIGGEMLLI